MPSKGHARLDAGCKRRSLQGGCRLFAWKCFFQTQQQVQEPNEEPLSIYVIPRLMPSSDPVQMSMLCMLCENLDRPYW
ncbi:hypothetical protein TNCV_4678231 [Trichonephila clavipes]|nr:hypothetical protein TNCV_4678231 [Trichonephila clavipes]